MPQKELSAIEFFKRHYTTSNDMRYIKKNFATASMSWFYATCPNVALLWTALNSCTLSITWFSTHVNERCQRLANAMRAFEIEFYKVHPTIDIDTADDELDEKQLRKWADQLRRYVVPVSTGVSR